MLNQTVTIPEQDYGLFLEVIKRFRWKVANEQHYLNAPTLAELDKRMEHYKSNPESAMDNDEVIRLLTQDD